MRRRSRSGSGQASQAWRIIDYMHCRGFKRDFPSGMMSKAKLNKLYYLALPAENAHIFVDQIFSIFDRDGSGEIDFKVILGQV